MTWLYRAPSEGIGHVVADEGMLLEVFESRAGALRQGWVSLGLRSPVAVEHGFPFAGLAVGCAEYETRPT